ncbi:MAG: hypothetical protein KGI05_06670 [Thaumarchaeota archaeon]|nr:hypothetical protein [Nitrososphaerota archaeon]
MILILLLDFYVSLSLSLFDTYLLKGTVYISRYGIRTKHFVYFRTSAELVAVLIP